MQLSTKGFRASMLAVAAALAFSPTSASVLLLEDGQIGHSQDDCAGFEQALTGAGIDSELMDIEGFPIDGAPLDYAVIVACHLDFQSKVEAADRLADWVRKEGGGLFLTGDSGFGLESLAGLQSLEVRETSSRKFTGLDVRFDHSHPVTTGLYWEGAITQSPPMPEKHLPSIVPHLYASEFWPAYRAVPSKEAVAIARWHVWDAPHGSPSDDPAVVVRQVGKGRVIYSGALPGIYTASDWPLSWRGVIVNAVEWLTFERPLVELGYWPHGKRAAFSWTGDTESPSAVDTVPHILQMFAELGLEDFGTFYVVGTLDENAPGGGTLSARVAAEYPQLVEQIAQSGSEVGGHGDVHVSFQGQNLEDQRNRIAAMREMIEPLLEGSGEVLRGFRAPYISQDKNTWTALGEEGFAYDSGVGDTWAPTTLPYSSGPVLQLPFSMPMDWHLFEEHALDGEQGEAIWQDKLDYVASRRGLFNWVTHPWVIGDHLDLMERLLVSGNARGDIWMARQDAIADWWQDRRSISLDSRLQGAGRMAVTVSNSGNEAVDGASVWLRVGEGDRGAWLARIEGQSVPVIERQHAGARFVIAVVGHIQPASSTEVEFVRDPVFADKFEVDESGGALQ